MKLRSIQPVPSASLRLFQSAAVPLVAWTERDDAQASFERRSEVFKAKNLKMSFTALVHPVATEQFKKEITDILKSSRIGGRPSSIGWNQAATGKSCKRGDSITESRKRFLTCGRDLAKIAERELIALAKSNRWEKENPTG